MIALISPAKTMQSTASIPNDELTEPRFLEQANYILSLMSHYSSAELGEIFKISPSIARELKRRFESHLFSSSPTLAAIDSYDGVVYKHIKNKGAFTSAQKEYLQNYLCISSILYGLLRPLDRIMPYRMEGFVRLADNDQRVDVFWRDIQTNTLIDDINRVGGTLLYLASKEEQNAFHWKQVRASVQVIDLRYSTTSKNNAIIVQAKHYLNSGVSQLIYTLKTNEMPKIQRFKPNRYILATSLSLSPKNKDDIKSLLSYTTPQNSDRLLSQEKLVN